MIIFSYLEDGVQELTFLYRMKYIIIVDVEILWITPQRIRSLQEKHTKILVSPKKWIQIGE